MTSAKYVVRMYYRNQLYNSYGVCERHTAEDQVVVTWLEQKQPARLRSNHYETLVQVAGPTTQWTCERCEDA